MSLPRIQTVQKSKVHKVIKFIKLDIFKFYFINLINFSLYNFSTVWTQLAYRFNWRTAKPLGPSPAPGCDGPTSRCQTPPSMWTLGRDQPVIPGVTFIWWSSTLLWAIVGSLNSTFVTDWLMGLSVKLAYAFVLSVRFPSGPSQPL